MKKKIINSLILLSVLNIFCLNLAYGANYTFTEKEDIQPKGPNTLKGSVIYTPVNLTTKAVNNQPISSETMYQGQGVSTTLPNGLSYNGILIAPAGSTISGSVMAIQKAGFANRNGSVYIRFNSLTSPQGYRIPVSAVIKTNDHSGVLTGGTKIEAVKNYTTSTAIGAGSGALAGTIIGAVSDGSVGKGAAIAAAIGAGSGFIKELADKGKPVEIPTGATIEVLFDQPITISAPAEYNY